jgi:alkylated DNA repair protein alkB family protein 1
MFILRRLGFTSFIPEAAIVNYYHLDSTLSGHTDHSEEDLSAPLISISFGQSAIFLIGGQSKQVKPVPLLIRSGDVVIMSGASRLCYHGVPKIISPTGLQQVIPDCLEKIHLERLVGNCKGEPARCLTCVNDDGILSDSNIITTTNTGVVSIGSKRIRNEEDSNQITKLIKTDQLMVDSSICNNCHWLWINWEHFQSYLSYSRININVRQVGDITMKDK